MPEVFKAVIAELPNYLYPESDKLKSSKVLMVFFLNDENKVIEYNN